MQVAHIINTRTHTDTYSCLYDPIYMLKKGERCEEKGSKRVDVIRSAHIHLYRGTYSV